MTVYTETLTRQNRLPVLTRMRKRMFVRPTGIACYLAAFAFIAVPASADTMWTDWTTTTIGAPGSATGTIGGIDVVYIGELIDAVTNGTSPNWAPDSSFVGGTVTTSPSIIGDDLRLAGIYTGVNTVTFSSPAVNPVIAVWSLGFPGLGATFTFDAIPTLQAGGPNSQYGGSSVTVSGNVLTGEEGNGVVEFKGSFDSISWTDTPEYYYAFTVGLNGRSGTGEGSAPEPASLGIMSVGLGLIGLVGFLRRRASRS